MASGTLPPPPPPPGYPPSPPGYQPAHLTYAPPPPPSHRGAWVAVGVVATLLVIGGIGFAVLYFHGGTLHTIVGSDHFTQTVTVTLTVNGNQVYVQSLGPGGTVTWDVPESWGGQSCETFLVVAQSTGGGLGSQSAQATPSLCNGETINVDLLV